MLCIKCGWTIILLRLYLRNAMKKGIKNKAFDFNRGQYKWKRCSKNVVNNVDKSSLRAP